MDLCALKGLLEGGVCASWQRHGHEQEPSFTAATLRTFGLDDTGVRLLVGSGWLIPSMQRFNVDPLVLLRLASDGSAQREARDSTLAARSPARCGAPSSRAAARSSVPVAALPNSIGKRKRRPSDDGSFKQAAPRGR